MGTAPVITGEIAIPLGTMIQLRRRIPLRRGIPLGMRLVVTGLITIPPITIRMVQTDGSDGGDPNGGGPNGGDSGGGDSDGGDSDGGDPDGGDPDGGDLGRGDPNGGGPNGGGPDGDDPDGDDPDHYDGDRFDDILPLSLSPCSARFWVRLRRPHRRSWRRRRQLHFPRYSPNPRWGQSVWDWVDGTARTARSGLIGSAFWACRKYLDAFRENAGTDGIKTQTRFLFLREVGGFLWGISGVPQSFHSTGSEIQLQQIDRWRDQKAEGKRLQFFLFHSVGVERGTSRQRIQGYIFKRTLSSLWHVCNDVFSGVEVDELDD